MCDNTTAVKWGLTEARAVARPRPLFVALHQLTARCGIDADSARPVRAGGEGRDSDAGARALAPASR
ncbi:hypothetical protein [Rhodosalinus sediminis]|uniref:hypothetical protein n=1 Tax=Rhodosalinus sediminis TaxID=1940533 RepID=UPI001314F8A5|nr:hypothetical protein [Rhodosalinus sediminis]